MSFNSFLVPKARVDCNAFVLWRHDASCVLGGVSGSPISCYVFLWALVEIREVCSLVLVTSLFCRVLLLHPRKGVCFLKRKSTFAPLCRCGFGSLASVERFEFGAYCGDQFGSRSLCCDLERVCDCLLCASTVGLDAEMVKAQDGSAAILFPVRCAS